ncbi:MAG: hypothetical protein NZ529_06725 [Cytophagaceae bacterium]|nr:hypothetical protein [Cytophagaceae bacterium]MDW8456474.1 hypothetical protein [Cytophagaceae bacterium]
MNGNQIFVGIAPGRLDVMGGIADYSGSLVLQLPITNKTKVELKLRNDYLVTLKSSNFTDIVNLDFKKLLMADKVDYQHAKNQIREIPNGKWVGYVLGCILVLCKEQGINFQGADIYVESDVPLGKGVSSSAALEIATIKAITEAFNLSIAPDLIPTYGQMAENYVVGAPCGIMDQMASYFGKEGHLLPIKCQPNIRYESVRIPDEIKFVGFDSGVKHDVSDDAYGSVRTAAFMGYSIIAKELGVKEEELENAYHSKDWTTLPYGGYLSNITPEELKEKFAVLLPHSITGRDFKKKYGWIIDNISIVKPDKTYYVKSCASHPIMENYRNHLFWELIKKAGNDKNASKQLFEEMGKLMIESHESYSTCGLGHPKTDEILESVKSYGPKGGLYGARITGGGSGGTVCIMLDSQKGYDSLLQIKSKYEIANKIKITLIN